MNYKVILVKICYNNKGIIKNKINKINTSCYNIKTYLESIFNLSIYETLRLLYNNIYEIPKCPCCGKPLKYIGKKNKQFQKYCSNSCRSKLVNKYIWINGQKQYNLNNYGVEYNTQTEIFKQRRKETLLSKYGDEHYNNIPKRTITNFDKYFSYTYNNPEKHKQTCISYYNVPYYTNPEKRYETMKQNNSFNVSKPEDECYNLLKEKYPDVIRQYRDERYPFNCDFYVPSLDLFIEYQGTWTHGGKLFEGTEEDLQKLQNWKNKNTKYYDNAIYTWTDLDVRKRNIALTNKLNYIELWNINEVKQWIINN